MSLPTGTDGSEYDLLTANPQTYRLSSSRTKEFKHRIGEDGTDPTDSTSRPLNQHEYKVVGVLPDLASTAESQYHSLKKPKTVLKLLLRTTLPTMAAPTSSIPATTRALFHNPQEDSLTRTTRPAPTPDLDADEHLIRVHTTAPCAGELTWWKFGIPKAPLLHVPGQDVAGTIVLAPPTSSFKPGDAVYARIPWSRPGAAQEYTILLGSEIALKPKNLDFVHAATVPMSALTAWQLVFDQAGFKGPDDEATRGKAVVVTAASGNVGLWCVQLARIAGFERIVGTYGGDADMEKLLREIGATDLVDYKQSSLAEWVSRDPEHRKVDLVVDCFGRGALADAWNAVKDGGQLLSVCEPPESRKPADCQAKDVTNRFFIMDAARGKDLARVTEFLENGKCRAFLDSVYEFNDFEAAFERVEGRHARGKVVIKVMK
ncbi:hypothetical protein DIZ76_011112 [Coccidioides immitis]|nr:hypothetical protein DIZ76_011112 [Coccidioides immitis]